jgi:hypothetical protein
MFSHIDLINEHCASVSVVTHGTDMEGETLWLATAIDMVNFEVTVEEMTDKEIGLCGSCAQSLYPRLMILLWSGRCVRQTSEVEPLPDAPDSQCVVSSCNFSLA